jgi:GGDEF domain-containing protein
VLPLARKLNVVQLRLASSLACAVHSSLLATFFNNLLSIGINDDLALENLEKMMAATDACLYQAKHGGRNKIHRDTSEWR